MYSWFLRFVYSSTYYIHLGIVAEIYKISKHGAWPTFTPDQTVLDQAVTIIQLHYPLLLIVLCLIIAKTMVKGTKNSASYTVQMKSSDPFGVEILYTGVQIVPYLTLIFREQLFGFRGAWVLVLVTVLFLTWHGSYNLSLLFLGYRQYRVKTENSTFWLICRRKISNFSSSESVHTLQDNVFVRHE